MCVANHSQSLRKNSSQDFYERSFAGITVKKIPFFPKTVEAFPKLLIFKLMLKVQSQSWDPSRTVSRRTGFLILSVQIPLCRQSFIVSVFKYIFLVVCVFNSIRNAYVCFLITGFLCRVCWPLIWYFFQTCWMVFKTLHSTYNCSLHLLNLFFNATCCSVLDIDVTFFFRLTI